MASESPAPLTKAERGQIQDYAREYLQYGLARFHESFQPRTAVTYLARYEATVVTLEEIVDTLVKLSREQEERIWDLKVKHEDADYDQACRLAESD